MTPTSPEAMSPPAKYQLKISFSSGQSSSPFFLMNSAYVRIGASDKCDIWLKDTTVAPLAATIQANPGGEIRIRNTGSTGSLLLNESPIQESVLKSGLRLQIGIFKMRLEFVALGTEAQLSTMNTQAIVESSNIEKAANNPPDQTEPAPQPPQAGKAETKGLLRSKLVPLLVGLGVAYLMVKVLFPPRSFNPENQGDANQVNLVPDAIVETRQTSALEHGPEGFGSPAKVKPPEKIVPGNSISSPPTTP